MKYHDALQVHIKEERRKVTKGLKDFVYLRDWPLCQICLEYIQDNLWEIDHLIPLSRWGYSNVENLQLTHRFCNRTKGVRCYNGVSRPPLFTLRELEYDEERVLEEAVQDLVLARLPKVKVGPRWASEVGSQAFIIWGDTPSIAGQLPLQ